jgi:hypothetical protein
LLWQATQVLDEDK